MEVSTNFGKSLWTRNELLQTPSGVSYEHLYEPLRDPFRWMALFLAFNQICFTLYAVFGMDSLVESLYSPTNLLSSGTMLLPFTFLPNDFERIL